MLPQLEHPLQPFPATHLAWPTNSQAPGLLAQGGVLSVERLSMAYSQGIFPWYSPGQPILWWAPDPRLVLPCQEFKVSRSLRKTLKSFIQAKDHEIRIDTAFGEVLQHCAQIPRNGQKGTWITPEIYKAYHAWHKQGVVHSIETWINGCLVGGLYGVHLGRMFFGESMFAHTSNASKIALAALIALCLEHHIPLIDCQQDTAHLRSLGARCVSRSQFEAHLASHVQLPSMINWSYDVSLWDRIVFSNCHLV